MPPEKAEIVWDAIALHSTSGIPKKKGSEIALVQIGAGIDVFGYRPKELGMEEIRQVITEVSREGFGRKLVDLLADLGHRKRLPHVRTFVGEIAHEMGTVQHPPLITETIFDWAADVESNSGAGKQ